MSTTPRAVAGASRAVSHARGRVSKRTRQSSPAASLSSLISLYHLTPTFVPASNAARLQQHVTNTLAPVKSSGNKPRPHHLIDLVYAAHDLDRERTKLDTESTTSPSSASLLGVKLRQGGYQGESFAVLPFANDGLTFDYHNSITATHQSGQEPPLSQRVRRIVDTLHGTAAGGRAGLDTIREQGAKAVEWKDGLRDARTREREREAIEEREAEAFGKEFAA